LDDQKLKKEAARLSQTYTNIYQSKQRNNKDYSLVCNSN